MALVFLAHLMVALGIFLLMAQFCRTLVEPMVILYLEVIRPAARCLPADHRLLVDHHLPVARDRLVHLDLRDPRDRLVAPAVAEADLMEEGLASFVLARSSLMT